MGTSCSFASQQSQQIVHHKNIEESSLITLPRNLHIVKNQTKQTQISETQKNDSNTSITQYVKSKTIQKQKNKKVNFKLPANTLNSITKQMSINVKSKQKDTVISLKKIVKLPQDNIYVCQDKIHQTDLQQIDDILKKHAIFCEFSEQQRRKISSQMKYCVVQTDEIIYSKGDQKGKCLQNEKKILNKGDIFGDLEIVYDFLRRSTINALKSSLLVLLQKQIVTEVLSEIGLIFQKRNFQILFQINCLQILGEDKLWILSKKCITQVYQKNQVIFHETDPVSTFIIVKQGICCDQNDKQYFHTNQSIDTQFQTNQSRKYTLIARTRCTLLVIKQTELINLKNQCQNSQQKKQIQKMIEESKLKQKYNKCDWNKTINTMILIHFKEKQIVFLKKTIIKPSLIYIIGKSKLVAKQNPVCELKPGQFLCRQTLEQLKYNYYAQENGYYTILKLNENKVICQNPQISNKQMPAQ